MSERQERQVVIWNQDYTPQVTDGEREEIGSWSQPYTLRHDAPWFGSDPVTFAVGVIESDGCGTQLSAAPDWSPGTWHSAEPRQDHRDGTWTERSAHLHGFTGTEAKQVYRQLTARRADRELEAGR